MMILERIGTYFQMVFDLAADPQHIVILLCSVLLGIIFGAMPGLTSTLGVALLTALTYGMDTATAMLCLLAIYVGGTYGGSYASILINIPGTAASAATALDGYPLACKGEAGRAIGLTTTASAIGTIISMLFLVSISPLISFFALQFTSFEFFLLAFFGILISGTLTSPDLVIKGWIAGFLGLFLSCVGRDLLQFYPRFTFGISELDSGIEVVPVLIGAFGIPQIIQVLRERFQIGETQKLQRILPEFGTIVRNIPKIIRSALIGVGIGSVPGIGEDIAAWVSYGAAKNTSKHPERFGKGEITGVLSSEVANNACVGGAMIPLLNLGIPGSPPAAMLLGALMLHGVTPGPMITFEHPTFIMEVAAILLLASLSMWVVGMLLAKQVVKVLRIPAQIFMPVIGILCIIGSYSLGMNIWNLYLMLPVGIISYFLIEMGYPIAPLVIGVILGPMADENLRRALMVSQGSFLPIFTRPVSLTLFLVIVWTVISQFPAYRKFKNKLMDKVFRRKSCEADFDTDNPEEG
ncbi:MAG: tripartite tricarboxylate transporter permease [Deltaproteobacteria bacterium]|jgi:putative tricarboxylic transport membrane protein|nr:tripartite tricarboxylate transporter permease [Deltaproteobacteria bacterium]MBW2489127.1 tripartite tricarboxylate transporter permease [Deltaproteobacteria bacterium]MBW2516272.1 tripartite tricarboxylate transporter permease [Deltaproteobacteria bacterium]